jgi:hypothetical protein
MATVTAYNGYSLNMLDLNLSRLSTGFISASVSYDAAVEGTTYPTVLNVEYNAGGTRLDTFAGNFSVNSSGAVTGGTVDAVYEYAASANGWTLTDALTNFSYSAVDFYNAALSGGNAATDWIEVNALGGNDTITGSTGNDILYGGIGNDVIVGGGGTDTAEYMGPRSEYAVSRNVDGSISVVDNGPTGDGADTLYGISYLQFSDQTDAVSGLAMPPQAAATSSPPPPPPPPAPSISVVDTTTMNPLLDPSVQAYNGPVAGLEHQYINTSADSLNITALTPDWFIHSGSGNDAIAANSGTMCSTAEPVRTF